MLFPGRTVSLLTGILLLAATPAAMAIPGSYMEGQRERFLQAETALKKGHMKQFQQLSARLRDYPLYPYLEFQYLRQRLSRTSEAEVVDFLQRYHDTPLAKRLHYSWLFVLAKHRRWKPLVRHFRETTSTRLMCDYSMALMETGFPVKGYNLFNDIWLTGESLPKNCDSPMARWKKAGYMSQDRIWQRIVLAMKSRKYQLAKYLARSIDEKDRYWMSLWQKIIRDPAYVIKADDHFTEPSRPDVMHAILVDGLIRLSRNDPLKAADFWRKVRQRNAFSDDEREKIERRLVIYLSRLNDEVGRIALDNLQINSRDHDVIEPHVLAAVKDREWGAALTWLGRLDQESLETPRWQYWRARILESMGRLDEARQIYLQITDARHYYGFLAADRIGDRYSFTHRPISVADAELLTLQHIPAIARAGELYALQRIIDARREWHFAIKRMDKNQLLKAAQLASNWGWHDRSIITLAHAKYWDDLELRFPIVHQKLIEQQAQRARINPAWAFAVIRQESAFAKDARSSAGAMGLMQLMPRTAREVARTLRIKRLANSDILDTSTNIQLGIHYLSEVKERFSGHQVLATAAYNAGGHRVRAWLPDENTMPADLWVENVPFDETREYLKRVLTYTVIYERRLGQEVSSLLKRMQPVSLANFNQ